MLAISSLAFTGLVGLATPAQANGAETITFDSTQYVTSNTGSGYFKVVADSKTVSGYGHAEWAPWATGNALNASATLVDWLADGVPWNHGWKVKTDVDSDNNVLYIHKPESSDLNAGITLLDRTDANTIISTGHMVVTAKVKALADASVGVTMKLTDTNGGELTKTATTSGTANTWSTLTFDFTSPTTGTFDSYVAYKKLDLMFDPTNAKAGQGHDVWDGNNPTTSATKSKLYFLDDVSYTLVAAPIAGTAETITFDSTQYVTSNTGSGYFKVVADSKTVSGYGHAEWAPWATGNALNASATLVDWLADGVPWNHGWKVKTDVDSDNNVLYIHKPESSDLNAGITLLDRTDANTIISTGHMVVTAKVKALADASVGVTMKLTDTNGGELTKTATTSGTANTWSTLTFDFTSPTTGTFDSYVAYKKLDLMFDPTNAKAGQGHDVWDGNNPTTSATKSKLYFLDDVSYTLVATGGGDTAPTVPVAHRFVPTGSTGLIGKPYDKGAKGWFQYYSAGVKYYTAIAEVGTSVTLKWHITDTSGAAYASKAVNLIVGKSYSFSSASYSTTYTGATSFSTSASTGATDAKIISGTTDASGDVSWTLTNTDTVGQTRPADLDGDIADGGVYSQITVILPGGSQLVEDQDIIDLHFVKAAGSGGDGPTAPSTLVNFEISDSTGYSLGVDGTVDFGRAVSSLSTTAPAGGSSASLKAAKVVKAGGGTDVGAACWAGTSFLNFGGTNKTLVSVGNKVVSMNVYAPSAGQKVRFKIENSADVNQYVEQDALTTKAGWQTLAFDFTTPVTAGWQNTSTYNKATVFLGFTCDGPDATNESTWYFDDVAFNGAATPAVASEANAHYNIKLTSPVMAGNSFDASARFYRGDFASHGDQAIANGASDHAYVYYAAVGSTLTLTYHVDNGAIGATGDPVVGKVIRLIVGKNYSDSKASFNNAAANPGDYPNGTNEVILVGTTNASGDVTFTLVNTNATGSVPPASATSDPDTIDRATWVKSNFYPTTGTGSSDAALQNETIDNLWPYFYSTAVPTSGVANPNAYKLNKGSQAVIDYNLSTNKISCEAPEGNSDATYAAFYLFVNHKLIAAKRSGEFLGSRIFRQIDVPANSATLTTAYWNIAPSWNKGHIALINCVTHTGNSSGVAKSTSKVVTLARVGKRVPKSSANSGLPTDVTMRLVSPALVKDAAGSPVDYVDFSADPVKNHWDQYYGKADGGLGVFYKYLTAGSTTTLKYHVTDSKTKQSLPYYNVWLIVNKNYGGNQAATFTFDRNGLVTNVTAHGTDLGETQISGITDDNGDVTFTLVNTNSANSAEPKPSALNVEQPSSVSSVYSTITLTAHLGTDETHETKDIIWAHIVKP